jgi:hypothetical protein
LCPELYKCNSKESTFVEFCVDGINLNDENNFIDSLGLGRLGPGSSYFDESGLVGKVVRWGIRFNSLLVHILPLVDTTKQNVRLKSQLKVLQIKGSNFDPKS